MLALLSTHVTGVVLALLTAVFWAISPLCWASVGRRIGSFNVLLLRSALAGALLLVVLLPLYALFNPATMAWPSCAQWAWLIVSGATGMGIGDALGYEAIVTIGPRRSTQINTLAPVAAVLLGFALGEALTGRAMMGIAIVIGATAYAVLARQRATHQEDAPTQTNLPSLSWNTLAPQEPNGTAPAPVALATHHEPGRVTTLGILYAVGGAVFIGLGAVAGRQAFRAGPLDPVLATVIRVGSSGLLLWLIPLFTRRVRHSLRPLGDGFVLSRMALGTLAGPIVGMLCYVTSLKFVEAGLVSTLSSTSPLFILPMIMLRYKARIPLGAILATLLAAAGVALISLH